MARLTKNSPITGLSGGLGKNLVFRQVGGETIVSIKPTTKTKRSDLQKANQGRFGLASDYAKIQSRDPLKREHYKKLAKKLKLPNAYTAALTEYMRKPEIGETQLIKDKKGRHKIKVNAFKKGFEVKEVKAKIHNKEGGTNEVLLGRKKGENFWYAKIDMQNNWLSLEVITKDILGNMCSKMIELAKE